MREIVFYRKNDGHSPIEEFLDSLSSKEAKKVAWVLKLIEDLEMIPRQYFKKLVNTDDIWEVRIQYANNIYRLLGFFDGGAVVLLTNGFVKKTQKTPKAEIKLAEKRKQEYLKGER